VSEGLARERHKDGRPGRRPDCDHGLRYLDYFLVAGPPRGEDDIFDACVPRLIDAGLTR